MKPTLVLPGNHPSHGNWTKDHSKLLKFYFNEIKFSKKTCFSAAAFASKILFIFMIVNSRNKHALLDRGGDIFGLIKS